MQIKEKVSLIRYGIGTFISILLIFFIFKINTSINLLTIASAITNQFLLFKSIGLVLNQSDNKKGKGFKIGIYFILKTSILVIPFYLIATYYPENVIYAVLIYIFQLLILGLSIKRTT